MRTAPAAVVAAAAALLLAGCSDAVVVPPAPDAADPVCARVLAEVPERVADLAARETTAQAALAWGEPPVVLRCGVEAPRPTGEPCVGVETPQGVAVDWVQVVDERGSTYTTYGRDPALELSVPTALTDVDPALPAEVLAEVAPAVAGVEQTRQCL